MAKFTLRSRFYYSRLSPLNQGIYRKIYDVWAEGKSNATISLPGIAFQAYHGLSLHDLVSYIIADNPHLFHLETNEFRYARKGESIMISATNLYSIDEYTAIYKRLLERVHTILQSSPHTYEEKIRYFHDTLADSITYNVDQTNYRSKREIHTIVGALLNQACVCDGYARAMRLLCDLSGISCIVVNGMAPTDGKYERHSWNILRVNNCVYHVDVTWDSCLAHYGHIPDPYFLRSDDVFQKDHIWDESFYPKCPNDYLRREPLITKQSELNNYILDQCVSNGLSQVIIAFRISEAFLDTIELTVAIHRAIDHVSNMLARNIRYEFTTNYSVDYVEILLISKGGHLSAT